MKTLKVFACVALVLTAVSCSRDPDVVKRKYLESGNRYFEKGKYKEAHIMYRNALRKDARYGEAYYRLGLTELKLGNALNAYRSFLRATETDPRNIDAKVQTGRLALAGYLSNPSRNKALADQIAQLASDILAKEPDNAEGLRLRGYYRLVSEKKPQDALADFRRANQVKPNEPDIVLPLVETLFSPEINQPEEAEKLARQMIEKQKTYFPMYDLLYLRFAHAGRIADAEQILKTKVANNPTSTAPLVQLAAHYQATDRPADARNTINRLIADAGKFQNAYMEAGRFYRRLHDFETARSYFEQGARTDKEHRSQYRKAIAEILILQQKPAEARRLLDEIIKDDPKDEDAKSIRASLRIDTGDPEQIQLAIADLESSIKQSPKNPVIRFNYARALVAKRQFEQARTQFEEAIRLNPMYLAPRLALSEMLFLRGEFGAARQAAREVIEKVDPSNLPAQLIETSALAASGERAAARRLLDDIVRRHPESYDAQVQVAALDLEEQKFDSAEAGFAKLYKRNPADLRGLIGLVETYARRGQYDRAIQTLKQELAKTPDRVPIRVALGNLCQKAGRIDEAIGWFEGLQKTNPGTGDVYLKLGECYRAKHDYQKAIESYERAQQLQPNDALTHLQLAVLYDTTGRRELARPAYEQVLRLQPDNAYALNNLAYLIADTGGDLDAALTLAQKAKQKLPEHPDVSDTLGWIYIKKNLTENAVKVLSDLVAKQPNRPTFRYHLGLALYQKGDKAGAKRELTIALSKGPTKDEEVKIKELLARIG